MDPGGRELESSLPLHENPCLIVEDSQPDGVALDDDPESSYRALLSRRLSHLQPAAHSPVLVSLHTLHWCSPLTKNIGPKDKHGGFGRSRPQISTVQVDISHVFSLLESDARLKQGLGSSRRSEVSSSSSSEPCGQTDRALRAQALLHSQGRSVTGSHGDDDILSSQEDMFDAEKTGTAVDSTVADNQTHPTLTPAHTLGLLHFSGQGTLVQETLSQNSTDCVAPTPEHFSQAPLIVPNSPTNPEYADEPMDTSQPPEDQSMEREGGPSQIAAFSKPLPKASTPLSQNSPSFVLDRTLSMPSQPEFSHDVFAPTPSPEGGSCSGVAASQEPQGAAKAAPPSPSLPRDKPPPAPEPPAFTLALQLTVNTQSAVDQPPPPPEQQEEEEDSQATQIEEPLCVDESQSVRCSQRSDHGAAASSQRNAAAVAAGPDVVPAGSQRRSLDRAAGEDDSRPSQKSDAPARAAVGSVNVAEGGGGTKEESGPRPRPTADSGAAAERPLNAAPCTVSAQPALPQAADGVNVAKGPGNAAEPKAAAAGKTPPLPETLSAGGEEEEEEEESMEEEEVTIGRDGSALGLALSQSQLPSPEPMEEEEESRGGKDEGVTDGLQRLSERHSQASQQSKSAGSQPACSKVSTNGHRVHPQTNDSQVTPDRLSQKDRAGPEADGPKDKSLSDSSGEIPFNFTLPKEGDLIGPAVVATPPLVNQLKQTPRHSTPIEINSFSEKPPAVGDVSAATSDIVAEESGEEGPEKEGGKLSLRMRLVTPVEEGSSERFSLQKPSLSEEDASVVKVTTVAKAPYAESPPFQRAAAPSHRRHVRTTQEVRTTVTRIITDVYYEDGKEVDRKVTEENEEPVVDCQVLDSDLSPCRTASSMTSGDLGDVSSLSSKLSGGTTGSGGTFAMPPSRGGRASRGGGPRVSGAGPPGQHQLSSSEEEPPPAFARVRLPVSPPDAAPPSLSDSLRSSPEQAGSAGGGGSSFVGLRVVAKWSSNAYFYPGRITKDAGEGRFGLRFDDGYECEVSGGDILLCDPVPAGTEVTALLEEEYFSVGVVKGHKTEGQELYYSVEREGQSQWHSRSSVILSLEQGNRLREQHSLGPYEPASPLAKASDISLDNLVEGKRRRRGGAGGQGTPTAISSGNPRTPGPSGKRKLMSSTEERTPAKRGRRGGGGGRRLGVCNTSGSGTDLPAGSGDMEGTHGPLPQNASLFLGFAFMLTASSETDRLTNKLAGNDDEEYVQTAPYNKGYTESQLQAGGGFVLLDFNEEQCKAAYQSLLIADQHCRTRKYLLCVASGVPCVSHIWVHDCCKDNKLLNYRNYLLPAGMGPDEQIVEWHPRCKPFEALRVLLVFGESEELWVQLLTLSGALTVRHYQAEKDGSDIPAGKFDVVVTDGDCPLPVEKSAASQKLPLVSAEWLIQSLICGERLGYRSKPQYQHDYSSSTTTTLSSSTSS
uniref:Tumor protein p53 binding protein, 1 n=1 Tax=Gadus morhua TaxID=8049 RepID=A0A8C5AVQ2_GADMO